MKGLASNLCKYVACVLLASLLAVGFTSIGMSAENPSTASLIVRIVSGLSAEEQQAVIQRNGGEVKSSIPQMNLYVIEVPLPDAEAVALSYLNDPQVARIELNNTRKVEWLPNDSLLGDQWHLPRIAWDQVYGNAALNSLGYMSRIAVLDTGINAAHSDLANVVVPGMSAFDPESDGTTDPNGHGTWLAGIAAAQTNNGEGIAGVAYSGTEVVPVQVIDGNGEGQDSDIIAGVIWAADHGVDVILMGFSNPGFSENLQLAIDYAWSKDVVLVAAVGNDSLTEPTYPAGDAGVMGVSATDNNDAPAGFSNSGPAVFLAAPGVDIMSTDASQGYLSTSGTSASSAIVAGVAGFMRAVDPTLSNGVIVGRIARNADPAGSADPAEAQLQVGNGRINMARALADTSMEEVKPEGAPGGGPFVGPYGIASVTSVTITSPTSASPISVTSLPSTISVSFNYVTSSTGTTTATVDVLGTSATNSKSLTPGTGSDTVSVDIPAGTANGSYNLKVTVTNSTGTGANNKNDNQNGAVIVNVSSCTVVSIITNPTDQSVVYGNDAIFSAAASGNPTPTVQWQVSTDGGSTWGNVGGAISTTLTIDNPTVSQSGSQYKAVFTNNCGGSSSSTTTAATLTVTPANATCTVSGYSGVYDAASHGASGSCSGIGGEDAGTLDLGDTFKNVPGGTAHWVFTGNGNYNDQSGDVAIAITKADATCSVSGYSGVYDAAEHGATGSCSGIGGEDAGTLNLGDKFKDVPGGTAHWTFTGNGNYEDQSGDVDIEISKADASCTVSGYSGVYDAAEHGATGSCSGIGGEDAGTLNLGDKFKDVPGGTAHWTFTGNGNYEDQGGDVDIVISKADASCSVSGYSGVYDAASHGASGSCSGIGGEDAGTLDLGATYKNVPGGTAHWVFTGNGNYNDQSGDVAIAITKADATCSVSGYSGVYDAASHGASGSCSGISGENAGTLDLGDTFKNVPGGTANWVFTGNVNYKDQIGHVDIVISKADPTCTITGYNVVYDLLAHTAAGSCSGVGGDGTLSGLDLSGTTHTNPGDYSEDPWVYTDTTGNYKNASGTVHDNIHYATGGMCLGSPGHAILQPIDADGGSVFKQKSTVPAKFRVCDAFGNSIGTQGVVTGFILEKIMNGTTSYPTESVDSTTPFTEFRWSATDQQWIFNMSTKGLLAGKTYFFEITLNDGSTIEFNFGLK